MLAKVSGGGISDRCGNFVEGVARPRATPAARDAAPTEAGAVPARHYQVTMRASFQPVGPGKPGSQLPVGDG
jgi:hypothetical protein